MAPTDVILTSQRVLMPGGLRPGGVGIRDGRITTLYEAAELPATGTSAVDEVLLPGLVDSHVHVNEPGRTHWEGFATATRAAALGGVTTIVDMPLNCLPPTLDTTALATKRTVAAPQVFVDTAFWGGAVPDNLDELDDLHAAGVRGFKAFLCDSGVDEYDHVRIADLVPLLQRIAALDAVLIVHAEDADHCRPPTGDPRRYDTWLASRPASAEVAAIDALVAACRETGARVHVLHLSAADAGPILADARAEGLPITVETCPHYLVLHAEDVPDGATGHKCAPPIRSRANADALWDLLDDGVVDAIVSDHSPCPPADKALDRGDFLAAWGGISSLQLGLSLVWDTARRRGHDLADVVGWMATAPADLAGLDRKGRLVPGADADLVAFDPDAPWEVDGTQLAHRHPVTPYDGRSLSGRVVTTWLAGTRIVDAGRPVGSPSGRLH